MKKSASICFGVLLAITCIPSLFFWQRLHKVPNLSSAVHSYYHNNHVQNTSVFESKAGIFSQSKIVIGAVVCRNISIPGLKYKYSDYTITMLKSVFLSAQLNNVSTVEIHLFLEHSKEDLPYIRKRLLKQTGLDKNPSAVNMTLLTYSAVDVIPEKYRDEMIYHKRYRCGYVRFFFPTALPNVDSIIHLDSDMLITGNVMKLWKELERMPTETMIGVAYNRQPQNNMYSDLDKKGMGGFPHVPPNGVNGGLLIMNLTRMRAFNWEQKFIRVYDDYHTHVRVTGQGVLNILLHFNPALYQIIPCHLHFLYSACERGWFCPEATKDSEGIHLVHGAAFKFSRGKLFDMIYQTFRKLDMASSSTRFLKDVVIPIREYYAEANQTECYNNLSRHLFKQFI